MARRNPMGTTSPIAVLVFGSMVVGAYLWQGPRAAVMTGLGCATVLVGMLFTWSRARALPPSTPRGDRREPPRSTP